MNRIIHIVLSFFVVGLMASRAAEPLEAEAFLPGPGGVVWQDRVLPLPKEMTVTDVLRLPAREIRVEIDAADPDVLPLETARKLMESFAKGEASAVGLSILLLDPASAAGRVPEALLERLAGLPNADQAYAIVYDAAEGPAPARLTLVGNTPVGMLYAARTLHQLVLPPDETLPDTEQIVPHVTILDWPDLELRGEWGGSPIWNMDWYSQWKLNMYKLRIQANPDESGQVGDVRFSLAISRPDRFMRQAARTGYRMIPFFGHIGCNRVWIESGAFHRALMEDGAEREKGFCWNDPALVAYLGEAMRKAVDAMDGASRDVEVWMTEGGETTCHCPTCGGANSYVLEADGILRAWRLAREFHPDLRLMLMLSQGTRTYNANAAILEMLAAEPDSGVSYYDGYLTYRISDEPLIFPELEEFARAGGRVDVVPTVFPYWAPLPTTIPRFIQFRMQEFVDKGLVSITGFKGRDRRYCEVSQAAMGEYAWNAQGRSPRAFARAYAVTARTGIEPDRFARWTLLADEAAYERIATGYLYALSQGSYNRRPRVNDPERFEAALSAAREADALARVIGDSILILESETTLAALNAVAAARTLQAQLRESPGAATAPGMLEELDRHAHQVLANAYVWEAHNVGRIQREVVGQGDWYWVHPLWNLWSTGMHPRMRPAAYGLMRAADAFAEQLALQGIEDPRGIHAPVELILWTPDLFDAEGRVDLELDLTDQVPEAGGEFILGFQWLDGDPVLIAEQMHQVSLLALTATDDDDNQARRLPLPHNPWLGRLTSHPALSLQHTVLLIPARQAGERLLLQVGMRQGGSGSTGVITLRSRRPFPSVFTMP